MLYQGRVIRIVNLLNIESANAFAATAAARNKDFSKRADTLKKVNDLINRVTDIDGLNAVVLAIIAPVMGDNDNAAIVAAAKQTLAMTAPDGSWLQVSPFAVREDNAVDAIAALNDLSEHVVLLREPDVLALSAGLGLPTEDAFDAANNLEMLGVNAELDLDYRFVKAGSISYMKDGVQTVNSKHHWRVEPKAFTVANVALQMAMMRERTSTKRNRVSGRINAPTVVNDTPTTSNVIAGHEAFITRNKKNFEPKTNQAMLLDKLTKSNATTDADRALVLTQFVKSGAVLA